MTKKNRNRPRISKNRPDLVFEALTTLGRLERPPLPVRRFSQAYSAVQEATAELLEAWVHEQDTHTPAG